MLVPLILLNISTVHFLSLEDSSGATKISYSKPYMQLVSVELSAMADVKQHRFECSVGSGYIIEALSNLDRRRHFSQIIASMFPLVNITQL